MAANVQLTNLRAAHKALRVEASRRDEEVTSPAFPFDEVSGGRVRTRPSIVKRQQHRTRVLRRRHNLDAARRHSATNLIEVFREIVSAKLVHCGAAAWESA